MSEFKQFFTDQQDAMVKLLMELASIESFTIEKAAVDQVGAFLADTLSDFGVEDITTYPRETVGDILLAKWNTNASGKPILIMAHMDTVWPIGTLETMPVRIEDDERIHGPGTLDMKAGIVIPLFAIKGLMERGEMPEHPIWFLFTSDEEVGSQQSQELIEELGQQAALVLVTEPANKDNSIKIWRKGVAPFTLYVKGRASHAGIAPEQGLNAIIEFANQALEINKLNDWPNGTSVSVTLVEGGSASNVIPAEVKAHIDVRVMKESEYQRILTAFAKAASYMPGIEVSIEPSRYRPPMEYRPELFAQTKKIADGVGIAIHGDGTGGGSDGSFTAALGIPTLDGLGAEGTGAHADHEHVMISSLPKKAALIAAILRDWQVDQV